MIHCSFPPIQITNVVGSRNHDDLESTSDFISHSLSFFLYSFFAVGLWCGIPNLLIKFYKQNAMVCRHRATLVILVPENDQTISPEYNSKFKFGCELTPPCGLKWPSTSPASENYRIQ